MDQQFSLKRDISSDVWCEMTSFEEKHKFVILCRELFMLYLSIFGHPVVVMQ